MLDLSITGIERGRIGAIWVVADEGIRLDLSRGLKSWALGMLLQVKYRLWRWPSWVNHRRLCGEPQMCQDLLNGILLQDRGNNFDIALTELAMGDIGVKHPV